MTKKVITLLLAISMILSLVACSDTKKADGGTPDATALKEVKAGFEKLKGTEKYLISNTLKAPDGNASYLEVVKKDCSYTEYPVNSDGTIKADAVVGAENTSYSLADWLDLNGDMYVNQPSTSTDKDTSDKKKASVADSFSKMPKTYANLCQGRRTLYLDKIIDSLTSLKKEKDTKKMDLGQGEETFTVYKGKIPSSTVKEVLGVGTKGLYESIIKDHGKDANIKSLCNQYLEKLEMDLTFSDANVTFGVADGVIRQMTIETGGLGTRLYFTKTVLTKLKFNEREKPDFSKCKSYVDSMKEVANYVAKYDSYDEAMDALEKADDTDSKSK